MSHATLISIVPFKIQEFKPGIYPGFFELAPCKNNVPEILNIQDSVYHVEIDENRTITVKCQAEDIAKSLVSDYVVSNLQYSIEANAAPGFMWKPGKLSVNDVLMKFGDDLAALRVTQMNWFSRLVQLADDDWEKSRQHKFISDMQRFAAKALGLDKPWIITPQTIELRTEKCPACQTLVMPEAIVCSQCRCVLNFEKYEKLKFAESVR